MTGRERALLMDWLHARGLSTEQIASPTLGAFADQVELGPHARIRLVAVARDMQAGLFPPLPTSSALRTGPDWLTAAEAARRCPASGTGGPAGRRDALALVLVGRGMSLRTAARLTTADVQGWQVGDVPLGSDPDARSCERCHLMRNLELLEALPPHGHRLRARNLATTLGHPCQRLRPLVRAGALLPAIDQHGWPGAGLSRRTLTRVFARRLRADAPDQQTPEGAAVADPRGDLDALLDRLENEVGDWEARVEEIARQAQASTSTKSRE